MKKMLGFFKDELQSEAASVKESLQQAQAQLRAMQLNSAIQTGRVRMSINDARLSARNWQNHTMLLLQVCQECTITPSTE